MLQIILYELVLLILPEVNNTISWLVDTLNLHLGVNKGVFMLLLSKVPCLVNSTHPSTFTALLKLVIKPY